jgi:hypothetical protein
MLKTKLAEEQAKVAQKESDLSNLMKSIVDERKSTSDKH